MASTLTDRRPARRRKPGWSVAVVLVAAAAAGAAPAQAGPLASTHREAGSAEKQEIVDFWTPERMREAKPLDATLPGGEAPERGPVDRSATPGAVPPSDLSGSAAAAPDRSGSAAAASDRSGSAAAAPGAIATAGGARAGAAKGFESAPVAYDRVHPHTTNGKVFARMPGVGPYGCSATVVHSRNRSLVFTAGHCVKDPGGSWARDFAFVPSYRHGRRPFGTWVWQRMVSPAEWAEQGNFNFDYGAVVMARRDGVPVERAVGGGQGFAWGQPRRQAYRAFGYPMNRFAGERMWSCRSGYLGADPNSQGGPPAMGVGCDMGVGASGGGWIVSDRSRREYLNSVSSFTYPGLRDVLFGPYFGDVARRVWRSAGRR